MTVYPQPAQSGIRSVPQTYRGVRFLSTLEADWAATLDSLGIAWEYEPEAVQLPSGELYRPDFYLPQCTTWLEVKGPHDERIDKVYELGEVAEHYPGCDRIPRPAEAHITAFSDQEWADIGRTLATAPDGPTRVIVHRMDRHRRDARYEDFRTIQISKPKRTILLDADVCEGLNETGRALIEPCCGGNSLPWRLVVIGRPAQAGATVWESAQNRDVALIKCYDCGEHSFFDETMTWTCRRCHEGGKVYMGGCWGSGDEKYADHYPFVKAPRPARRCSPKEAN